MLQNSSRGQEVIWGVGGVWGAGRANRKHTERQCGDLCFTQFAALITFSFPSHGVESAQAADALLFLSCKIHWNMWHSDDTVGAEEDGWLQMHRLCRIASTDAFTVAGVWVRLSYPIAATHMMNCYCSRIWLQHMPRGYTCILLIIKIRITSY